MSLIHWGFALRSTTTGINLAASTSRRALWAMLIALLGVVAPSPANAVALAQSSPSASLQRATRTELAARLGTLESQLASGARGAKKTEAEREIAETRTRLSEGDFGVGDRFLFTLTVDSVRSDTASVRDGLLVTLSNLPDLSLKGVLRSELNDVVTAHVLRYLKNARIRTVTFTQVSILGAVARPGYYWAAPDRPLGELIMMAGGPAPEANLREVEIKRANRVVLKGKDSRQALIDGRTIEQVDIRSGDEVRVATKRKANWGQIIQLMFVASSLFFAFVQFVQWYYGRQE